MNKHIATALAASALLAMPALAEDQGAAIAAQAQGESSAVTIPPEQFVFAKKKVEDTLATLGLSPGYSAEKKCTIVIGVAELYEPHLDTLKDFQAKRSAKALEAYINAKSEIIRSVFTDFKAEERLSTGDAQQSEEETAVAKKIAEAQDKVDAFAEKAGKPELEGADIDGDLVANLKELVFEPPAPATDTQEPAPDAQEPASTAPQENPLAAERDALVAEITALLKEAGNLPKPVIGSSESKTTLLSSMPLLGATVLTQAESWNRTTGDYQIAMAVLWSPKLQNEAKALASGNPLPADKPGKLSAKEWVAKQDLLAMVGPRRFVDKDGNAIVVGIASRDITGLHGQKVTIERQKADTDAINRLATSLMCDLETFRELQQNFTEYDDASSDVMEKLANKIQSRTAFVLQGVLPLSSKEGFHPLSGRNTYATAYYLDPYLSKDAMERMKSLYADAIGVENASQYRRGQHAGMESKLEEARNSTEKFEEGKAEAAADVEARVKRDEAKIKVEGAQGSSGPKQVSGQGGVVSGDNLDTIDLDF